MLLALLSKEPNTGYGAGRLLRGQLSHLWDARLQQIYAELAKLQSDGLVEAESFDLPNRPAKKVYTLTAAGEAALNEWLSERSPPLNYRDDFLVRLYCLERIPEDVLVHTLEERLSEWEAEATKLRDALAQNPRTDPARLGALLTLEAALARTEALARWCAKALSRLDERQQSEDTQRLPARRGRARASA